MEHNAQHLMEVVSIESVDFNPMWTTQYCYLSGANLNCLLIPISIILIANTKEDYVQPTRSKKVHLQGIPKIYKISQFHDRKTGWLVYSSQRIIAVESCILIEVIPQIVSSITVGSILEIDDVKTT